MTYLKVAKEAQKVVLEMPKDIESLEVYKAIIDDQFLITKRVINIQAIIYMYFFAYPVLYIIFGSKEEWEFKEKCKSKYMDHHIVFPDRSEPAVFTEAEVLLKHVEQIPNDPVHVCSRSLYPN